MNYSPKNLHDTEKVAEQYKTDKNLAARISIHDKYSTNKQGFGNWIYEQYELCPNIHILELGCGNAAMWQGRILPEGARLLLTDFSEGMLSAARSNVDESDCVSFAQVDIQNIPHPDNSFDVVIANMMLYHVPNLDRALQEVRRVLKPEGTFFCATYGENGIPEFVISSVSRCTERPVVERDYVFTLQNGSPILEMYFNQVEKRLYPDSLAVTDTRDLVAYMRTMTAMVDYVDVNDEELQHIFDSMKVDGVLTVPKEYGVFVCRK